MNTNTEVTEEVIVEKMQTAFLRRASVKKNKLTMDLKLSKVLDENTFKLGHIMLDLHEAFELGKPTYEPTQELALFKTPHDIVEYITEKAKRHS